ncbi:unnamed protein product [Adineta steineri]|uniref:G-protein coupled receptors family 1 profile domain-containing protein n=1 Tax=Adineta steineri TaxID=433720 RepID=A0A813Z5C3_9BILA|nr:unnamed protein product [Adineta steineri]
MKLAECLALVQLILTRYVLMICSILGIIGCFLNFFVFSKKNLRTSSCSIYFKATSIFNLLVIVCCITPVIIATYSREDPALYISIVCKTRAYTTHAFLMMSRSTVALTCVDRFALCSSHAHIRRLSQRHIAIRLVIITTILWLVIPIHVLLLTDVQVSGRCGGSGVYQIVYSIYATIVTSIPLVIMIMFSFWAIRSVQHSRARVFPIEGHVDGNENLAMRMKKRDIQLIVILISEVVVYLLSTVWYPLDTMYLTITASIVKTPDRVAIENFIRYLALNFFIFLNSCSLFYVHLLASKRFRHECKELFLNLFKHNQNNIELQVRSAKTPNHRQQINTFPNNTE